jgi:hypothetical protein
MSQIFSSSFSYFSFSSTPLFSMESQKNEKIEFTRLARGGGGGERTGVVRKEGGEAGQGTGGGNVHTGRRLDRAAMSDLDLPWSYQAVAARAQQTALKGDRKPTEHNNYGVPIGVPKSSLKTSVPTSPLKTCTRTRAHTHLTPTTGARDSSDQAFSLPLPPPKGGGGGGPLPLTDSECYSTAYGPPEIQWARGHASAPRCDGDRGRESGRECVGRDGVRERGREGAKGCGRESVAQERKRGVDSEHTHNITSPPLSISQDFPPRDITPRVLRGHERDRGRESGGESVRECGVSVRENERVSGRRGHARERKRAREREFIRLKSSSPETRGGCRGGGAGGASRKEEAREWRTVVGGVGWAQVGGNGGSGRVVGRAAARLRGLLGIQVQETAGWDGGGGLMGMGVEEEGERQRERVRESGWARGGGGGREGGDWLETVETKWSRMLSW